MKGGNFNRARGQVRKFINLLRNSPRIPEKSKKIKIPKTNIKRKKWPFNSIIQQRNYTVSESQLKTQIMKLQKI